MTRAIHKYTLGMETVQTLMLPRETRILSVHMQNGALCLWACVPLGSKDLVKRYIHLFGTGWPIEEEVAVYSLQFVGTVMDGSFVWHIFADLQEYP